MARKTNLLVRFVVEECAKCEIEFAITEDLYDKRRKDHKVFYCPNGHAQEYMVQSDLEKMKESRDACRDEASMWEEHSDYVEEELVSTKRSAAAYKGHITRIKTGGQVNE